MIYSPKFSCGSKIVITDTGETGEIIAIKAAMEIHLGETEFTHVTYYMIKSDTGVKKIKESRLKDVKDIEEDTSKKLDFMFADIMLLNRELNPEVIDNTIKELLKNNVPEGGKDGSEHHEGFL